MPDVSPRVLMWPRREEVSGRRVETLGTALAGNRRSDRSCCNEEAGSQSGERTWLGVNNIERPRAFLLRERLRDSSEQSETLRHADQQDQIFEQRTLVHVSSEQSAETLSRADQIVVLSTPTEQRTLVCTSLSSDIEDKLEELEGLYSNSLSPTGCEGSHVVSRRRQLMAGGSVLMERDTALAEEGAGEELQYLELEEHVWLLMWLVLGPQRLQHLGRTASEDDGIALAWDSEGARLVWRALQLCCSAQGSKSASAVPLAEEHTCDLACLRDHASRMLEVCAPTRELWRSFGWAGLTVDAVLHKVLKEDIIPHIALLPSVPEEVTESLRRIETCQTALKQLASRSPESEVQVLRDTRTLEAVPEPGRRKRGRPAKCPTAHPREPGRLERVFLWRFLLELLEDARLGSCLRWVQRDEGIFRILNTDMLARLWGRRHGNPRMTYEKMARAMRTYYRSRVLLPVPRARNLPRKLVYRFSPSVLQRLSGDSRSNVTATRGHSTPQTFR